MIKEKINYEFKIPKEELQDRVNNQLSILDDYGKIVPLKNLVHADYVIAMPILELESILKNIPLTSDKNFKSYENSEFKIFRIDPAITKMCQTFVLEEKLLKFQTEFGNLHKPFCFPRLSKMPAHYVSGINSEQEKVTGIYLPPIIEYTKDHDAVLIDGTHRGTIVHEAGTTIEVIGIYNSQLPLPCEPIPWHKNIVKEKPPIKERFKNLDERYFKDFGWVGVDG